LIQAKPVEIRTRCVSVLQESTPSFIPQGEFWELAYHPDTLKQICIIREYLLDKRPLDRIDIALRALLLGILHGPLTQEQSSYLSNQMPRTFSCKPDYSIRYWRKYSLLPPAQDVTTVLYRKACYTFNTQIPKTVQGKVVLADSRSVRSLSHRKFDWVITSPPYLGMATYEQDQWLRNWFLGGLEKVDYSGKNQLKHGSATSFVQDLSTVWSNTAEKCRPGSVLISRFGALPSRSEKTPAALFKESLQFADCGWKIQTIRTAGRPIDGKRQANQFIRKAAHHVEEIDVYAILNT